MSAPSTSIVITSRNRPDAIRRAALWYQLQNFSGELIVGDAGEDPDCLSAVLGESPRTFSWQVVHVPRGARTAIPESMNEAFSAGLAAATRDYAILSCDDDLILVDFLMQSEAELARCEASSVVGDRFYYSSGSDSYLRGGRFGFERNSLNRTRSRQLWHSNPFDRLSSYLDDMFHTMFSSARVETWRSVIPTRKTNQAFPHFAADFRWMLGIVARGPVAHSQKASVISVKHASNLSSNGTYARWGDPKYDWHHESSLFKQFIEGLLMDEDGTSSNSDRLYRKLEAVRREQTPRRTTQILSVLRNTRSAFLLDQIERQVCSAEPVVSAAFKDYKGE